MREIIISTESGSDLPENLVKKYDIKVIPMHIVMDGTSYADGTISVDKIYEYHNETKKIPTTSAVNVGEYIDFFTQIRKEHPTRKDIKRARNGFTPFTSKTAVTAAPKGKLPSTVRSGKSNILYVIYTPKERRAYIKP